MKLKFIALGVLLSFFSTGFIINSEEKEIIIKMPNERTLRNRLNDNLFAHFIARTDIIEKLAEKELIPLSLVTIIEASFYDYHESLKQAVPDAARRIMIDMANCNTKPMLYQELCKDNPEALDQLEKLGLYKTPRK